jgi:hypothetical protein
MKKSLSKHKIPVYDPNLPPVYTLEDIKKEFRTEHLSCWLIK